MAGDDSHKKERRGAPTRRSQRLKRASFWLVYVLFLLLVAECGARAFWKARGVPFFTAPHRLYRSFYPEVGRVEREMRADDEDCFDILMLGGSALHKDYGNIEHVLRERLTRETRACVRVHNLAASAHTSLDSLYKYRHLSDQHFDLVLVYHGVNEARANNCPSSVFREDYSHFAWYRLINDYERAADSRWFVFPYTVKFVMLKLAGRLGWSSTLPVHRPDAESLEYGCDVKTAAPFRRNLDAICDIAAHRGEPVLLMSFSYFIPEAYTEAQFERRSLDYTVHTFPVELWGKPACVAAVISAHNAAVADVAGGSDRIRFVDQAALIPQTRLFFNDLCHLTHEGCERFVENVVPTILEIMQAGTTGSGKE